MKPPATLKTTLIHIAWLIGIWWVAALAFDGVKGAENVLTFFYFFCGILGLLATLANAPGVPHATRSAIPAEVNVITHYVIAGACIWFGWIWLGSAALLTVLSFGHLREKREALRAADATKLVDAQMKQTP